MNGIVLVDKPQGVTSFDVVRQVRRWSRIRQVGHCGTLDPLATGLLPIAVGSATRLVEYLMADEKEYLATFALGAETDTQDASGRVLATHPWNTVTAAALAAACGAFTGAISQIPPMYSALKRDGVPLYRLARQGVEVERTPRNITISRIDLCTFAPPLVTIRVVCSKGTYIRTLVHDLGRHLVCGAHLTALRRERCGTLTVNNARTLDELQRLVDASLPLPSLSQAEAMAGYPVVVVREEGWGRLANGVAPTLAEVDGASQIVPGSLVCLLTAGRLAAVASFAPGGEGGRPGDFTLGKVFPDAILNR